jgi:transcriptional regulator with PAS, ATPase and Fis domain
MNKTLVTVSSDSKNKYEIYNQLTELIGDLCTIKSYCYDELPGIGTLEADLVLISASFIKDRVLPYVKKGSKLLVARRTINLKNLKQLFDIPSGTDVLIVNNSLETSEETVKELYEIGIKHLNFFPFNPTGKRQDWFNYAVTFGEMHLVPESIPNVMDMGTRLIDIMTIAEILIFFEGAITCDTLISSRYIRTLVKLSMELSEQMRHNEMLHRQMEMVISNIEDGVIITDFNQNIMFSNRMANEIFGGSDISGKNFLILLDESGSDAFDDSFININKRIVHISRQEISLSDDSKIQIIILKDVTKMRCIDEQYRIRKRRSDHTAKYTFNDIVYKSRIMKDLVNKAMNIAQTDSTVLIIGESGTGKELFAQSIHNASKRSKAPFVAINCAALSETLLESELFGYDEGAFTGARKGGRKGLFEQAHTGTIFLDEIGDAPYSIQTKLLRVLQEKEIMRVSGDSIIPIDVRIIAATNKDLYEVVERGEFRRDLYYRLKVLPLMIPPLREHKEDIELLMKFFITQKANRQGYKPPKLSGEIIELLQSHSWRGNTRELENIAEYIVMIAHVSSNLKADIENLIADTSNARNDHCGTYSVKNRLFDPKITEEALVILHIIMEATKKEQLVGRSKICEMLAGKGMNLTEQQVRTRLEYLKVNKLINTNRGRGAVITEKGKEFAANYHI